MTLRNRRLYLTCIACISDGRPHIISDAAAAAIGQCCCSAAAAAQLPPLSELAPTRDCRRHSSGPLVCHPLLLRLYITTWPIPNTATMLICSVAVHHQLGPWCCPPAAGAIEMPESYWLPGTLLWRTMVGWFPAAGVHPRGPAEAYGCCWWPATGEHNPSTGPAVSYGWCLGVHACGCSQDYELAGKERRRT